MLSRKRLTAAAVTTTGSNVQKEQRLKVSGRTEAVASFGQQRIWLHEQLYFNVSDFSMYNLLMPLIVKQGSLSIERVRSVLLFLIEQHTVLRTAVRFNSRSNQIEQYIQPLTDDVYLFQHSKNISTLEQLDYLLTNDSIEKYLDLEKGRVVKCHVVQRYNENADLLLHKGDLIVFTIHHIAFDRSSIKPFLKAFEQACWVDEHCRPTLSTPQYIDFALYEQTMLADTDMDSEMNKARRFWTDLMHDYDWDRIRRLAPDEGRTNQTRSGRGYSAVFLLEQHIVDAMMLFASTNNITMSSLSLACYYVFLFKLLNDDDDDLCVAGVISNRFKQETKDMIGMFINTLPYRIKVEPEKSFHQLVRKVQQLSNDILEHASLPYQKIIDLHGKREHHTLPSIFFQYDSLMSSLTQKSAMEITTNTGSVFGSYYDRDRLHGNGIALFDLSLTIAHDHHGRSTECFLDCSVDVFQNQAKVDVLSKRFQHMLTQLFSFPTIHESNYKQSFSSNETIREIDIYATSIFKIDLILPEEAQEMEHIVFCRQSNIVSEGMLTYLRV